MELRNMKIGIQGSPYSFHDEAALSYFGEQAEVVHYTTFRESCVALASNRVDYVVMAMENAIAGKILPNYELVLEYNIRVMAEMMKPIALHLVGPAETNKEEVRYIRSHPMAILQCSEFLATLPRVEVVEAGDTAHCVQEIAEKRLPHTAAIAGYGAAKKYGMTLLEENIHSRPHNYTRFWILSKGEVLTEAVNKASLSFCLPDKAGSLADVLFEFRSQGLNLSGIQSLPCPEDPEVYRFYADLEFPHRTKFLRAVEALLTKCTQLKVLGEYERAVPKS